MSRRLFPHLSDRNEPAFALFPQKPCSPASSLSPLLQAASRSGFSPLCPVVVKPHPPIRHSQVGFFAPYLDLWSFPALDCISGCSSVRLPLSQSTCYEAVRICHPEFFCSLILGVGQIRFNSKTSFSVSITLKTLKQV